MLTFAADKPLADKKVYNAYPDLSAELLTDMYFDWEKVDGNWVLKRISAKIGNQPHDDLEHDITLKYKVQYGNPDSGKDKYYLFWNPVTFAKIENLSLTYDRIVPESKGANQDNYIFYLYGPDDVSDPQATFKDAAASFYYNQEVTDKSNRPVHHTSQTIKDINGTFIRNHVTAGVIPLPGGVTQMLLGAAIYNTGNLRSISGDFIGNYAREKGYAVVQGGVISNYDHGVIGTISGTFIGNYAEQKNADLSHRKTASGGVIYNYKDARIGKIDGFFAGNYLYTTVEMHDVIAGTIANYGTITQGVHGTYIANFAYSCQTANSGVLRNFSGKEYLAVIGACESVVYNGKTYKDVSISGLFIGNFARGINGDAFGGVMRNNGEIHGSIIGDYIGNYAITDGTEGNVSIALEDEKTGASRAQGGVFYSTIKIANVQGDYAEVKLSKIEANFERNYASSKWGLAQGGAIFNENAQIDDIEGAFVGNYAVSEQYKAQGGAIFHNWVDVNNEQIIAEIGNIGTEENSVLFDANYVKGKMAEGGAIYVASRAKAKNIYANFEGNQAISELPDIESNMEVYHDENEIIAAANGGAIFISDESEMLNLRGTFTGNSAVNSGKGESLAAKGGAFYIGKGASIGKVTANFIGNYVEGAGEVRGGAMLVTKGASLGQISSLDKETPTFYNNSAMGVDLDELYLINGTAYSEKELTDEVLSNIGITRDELNRLFKYQNTNVYGGALRFDDSFIEDLEASFDANKTNGSGGALSNTEKGFIYQVSGSFTNNAAGVDGGAVHNLGTIGFLGEIAINEGGERVYKHELDDDDYAHLERDADGRVITEADTSDSMNKFGYGEYDGSVRGGFVNTNFTNNVVNNIIYNNGNRGHGAAIYTTDDLFLTVKAGQNMEISGNVVYYYDEDRTKPEDTIMTAEKIKEVDGLEDAIREKKLDPRYVRSLNTAIYVDDLGSTGRKTVYLVAEDGGSMTISDAIRGQETTVGGFVLRLRGATEQKDSFVHKSYNDAKRGTINLSGPIAEAYVIMDDVHLNIGTCINEFTFGKARGLTSYLYTDAEKAYTNYGRSDVFRRAHFSVRSGLVDLTSHIDENKITQFSFGTLTSYGKGYDYVNNAFDDTYAASDKVKASYTDTTFATWRVSVDLTNQVADLITAFEIRDKQVDGEIMRDSNNNLQMSNGRITLDQVTVQNVYDEFYKDGTPVDSLKEGATIKIQVLNLVVRDVAGNIYTDYTSLKDGDRRLDYTTSDAPIQLDQQFDIVEWEQNVMNSSQILAKAVRLATTRSYNDSIEFVGWRNALAAWAELTDDTADSRYTNVGWEWNGKDEKVFILKGNYALTRDVEDLKSKGTDEEKNGTVFGDTWTITSENKDYELDMLQQDLLTKVLGDQNARLENFRLTNVKGNTIKNDGKMFTLDSMSLEDALVITNNTRLTVTGKMTINNTITSAKDAKGEMFIENSSNKNEQTEINITGTVQNQNITHLESPTAATAGSIEVTEQSPMTVTNLQTSNADGTPTQAFRNFTGNSLTMLAGQFNLFDMALNRLPLVNLTVSGGKINVASSTVDLTRKTMGGIDASGQAQMSDGSTGIIWLENMKVTGDGAGYVTHVTFVPEGVGDAVQDKGIRNTTVYGNIWEYVVTYNDHEKADSDGVYGKNGQYTFTRTGNVNPEVQSGEAAQLAGGYSDMMQVYEYSFEHADLFSDTMENTRSPRRSDEYAIVTPVKGYKEAAPSIAPAYGCPTQAAGQMSAMWIRPYSSFEKMPLNNGPKVNTSHYGALVGADTSLREHRSGWADITSLYGIYMGSTNRYSGIRDRQDGMGFGLTETLYYGRFYTGLTGTIGTSHGRTNTTDGTEKYRMLMAGVASRTGYSLNLGTCRYVLQPTLLMSYTFINTADYTNASGVRMESDPLQVLQLHPYVKAIRHSNSGWDPYITAGYVHNFMGKTKFRADGEKLPELSIDPYVEYSIGVQKSWRSKYTLYGSATGRHGGRNGAEVSAGIRRTW